MASGLYKLAKEDNEESPIIIPGTEVSTFDVIHRFIYTVLDIETATIWDSMDKSHSILDVFLSNSSRNRSISS